MRVQHILAGLLFVGASGLILAACESTRPAEAQERSFVQEQVEKITALIPLETRFRRSGLEGLPGPDLAMDIVTADEGNSYTIVSDSLIGTVDSNFAELLLTLPTLGNDSTGAPELMVRASRNDGSWVVSGIYLR